MEFDDDLSNDIAAAISASTEPPAVKPGDAPPAEADSTPPPVEKASAGERARDEQGRFAPSKETAKPAAPDEKTMANPETGEAQPKVSQLNPPANWKGNAKLAWQNLAPEVQQAINEEYGGFTKAESELKEFREAVGERAQTLAAQYGTTANGLKAILAGADMLNRDPVGFVRWLVKERGLNLATISGQGEPPNGQQPQGEPSNPLEAEVRQLRSQLQNLVQQQTQAAQTPIHAEINRFAADPAHPYYKDVEQHMIALIPTIQGSPSERLQKAYEMATWANPDIRASLQQAERQKEIAANAAKVAAAKSAQVSISGSPRGAKAPDDDPDTDLEGLIRRNVERAFA